MHRTAAPPGAASAWTCGKESVKVWKDSKTACSGRVATARATAPPLDGEQVFVKSGRSMTMAFYSRSLGLIWVETSGKRAYAKPDAALKAKLDRHVE